MDRAYTVNEIDNLRRVLEDKCIWGSYHGSPPGGGFSGSYNQAEVSKKVEDMIRTCMIAGHTAEDLLASEPESERLTQEQLENERQFQQRLVEVFDDELFDDDLKSSRVEREEKPSVAPKSPYASKPQDIGDGYGAILVGLTVIFLVIAVVAVG